MLKITQTKNRTDLKTSNKKVIEITKRAFDDDFIRNEIKILSKR